MLCCVNAAVLSSGRSQILRRCSLMQHRANHAGSEWFRASCSCSCDQRRGLAGTLRVSLVALTLPQRQRPPKRALPLCESRLVKLNSGAGDLTSVLAALQEVSPQTRPRPVPRIKYFLAAGGHWVHSRSSSSGLALRERNAVHVLRDCLVL